LLYINWVYIGQVYSGIIAGLAVQLVIELVVGSIINIIEVVDCTGALQAIFTVLVV